MNKVKSLFFLLFCFTLFACTTVQVSAQDYRLSLGKAWIRYDSDSNLIKFGAPIQPPKIAREFNSPLFNFNSTQFFWSNLTGLNLISYNTPDTILASPLIVVKDTGDGEFIPYNKRTYTIYKPYYHNQLDIYDLKVKYESTANPSATTEFNLLNNAYVLYDNVSLDDNFSGTPLDYPFVFPRPGTYYINCSYEYWIEQSMFHDGSNQFDIQAMFVKYPVNVLSNNWYVHSVAPDVMQAFRNSCNLNTSVIVTADELNNYYFQIVGIQKDNYPMKISKLIVTAILIN